MGDEIGFVRPVSGGLLMLLVRRHVLSIEYAGMIKLSVAITEATTATHHLIRKPSLHEQCNYCTIQGKIADKQDGLKSIHCAEAPALSTQSLVKSEPLLAGRPEGF